MTPEQCATLRWFKWNEFRHPEGMDFGFVKWLDQVRHEYGWPLVLTSDFRTPLENAAASGSALYSRHLVGQAVDMKFPPTSFHVWRLVKAVMDVPVAEPIELELVNSDRDQHVHVAWLKPGQASKLVVAAD